MGSQALIQKKKTGRWVENQVVMAVVLSLIMATMPLKKDPPD